MSRPERKTHYARPPHQIAWCGRAGATLTADRSAVTCRRCDCAVPSPAYLIESDEIRSARLWEEANAHDRR
jgi:hypothetical protein